MGENERERTNGRERERENEWERGTRLRTNGRERMGERDETENEWERGTSRAGVRDECFWPPNNPPPTGKFLKTSNEAPCLAWPRRFVILLFSFSNFRTSLS